MKKLFLKFLIFNFFYSASFAQALDTDLNYVPEKQSFTNQDKSLEEVIIIEDKNSKNESTIIIKPKNSPANAIGDATQPFEQQQGINIYTDNVFEKTIIDTNLHETKDESLGLFLKGKSRYEYENNPQEQERNNSIRFGIFYNF